MIRELSKVVVPLTRSLAEEFSTMPAWSGERGLKEKRLNNHRLWFESGNYHSPDWVKAVFGTKVYRINGQHSSTFLASLNGDFPQNLSATIHTFEVDSEQDLADLFERFDRRESIRTSHEKMNAHAKTERDLDGISVRTLSALCSGISLATGTSSTCHVSLVHTHKPFITWAAPIMSKQFARTGICAGMYMTWKRDPTRAGIFWAMVQHETHPSPQNGTRLLARFIATELAKTRGSGPSKWTARAVMIKCMIAWNAHWKGKTTDLKYYAKAESLPQLV